MPFVLPEVPVGGGTEITFEEWLVSLQTSLPDAINAAWQTKGDGAYHADFNYDKNDVALSGSTLYLSLVDGNLGNSVSDGTKWRALGGGTGGSPLSVTDSTGDTEANVALLDFPHLTLVDGQLVSYEFFEDGDTIPAGTAVAVVEVAEPVETRQTKTTNYTMLATDRRLVMIATANRTVTLRPTSEMYASGDEYGFAFRANGTPGVLLTLQADGAVIYNGTTDVSTYTVDDGEMIVLVGYLRADNTPGLWIKSST